MDLGGLFDRIDKDRSGSIEITELADTVKRIMPDITARQLRNLMKAADVDGSGTLERDEFIAFVR